MDEWGVRHLPMRTVLLGLGMSFLACTGTVGEMDGGTGGGAGGGVSQGGGAGGGVAVGGGTGTGGGTATGGGTGTGGGAGTCMAGAFLASLGKDKLLVGASMEDATAARAPFTLRYLYLAGGLFPGSTPCASCQSGCNDSWWGCWQDTSLPPGAYVRNFVAKSKANGQIPMITYYEVLAVAGWSEGADEVTAMNDVANATQVFNDWRFVVQQVGNEKALLHLEPDFWGYAQQGASDPHAIPAKVKAANPTDCASMEDSLSGFASCLVAMAHKYAPNAKVGLHASGWATNIDVTGSSDTSLNVAAEAAKVGNFLKGLAPDADYIVVEASDRDAGWYQTVRARDTWWDDTNATVPNFHRAFSWAKTVAETAGKPLVWWQLPVGNASQGNTNQHYQDNRVAYFFAHADEIAAAHGAGFAFGAGESAQTTPETDGDFLVGKVQALSTAGGQAPCP